MAYLAVLSASEGRKAGFAATTGIATGLLIIGARYRHTDFDFTSRLPDSQMGRRCLSALAGLGRMAGRSSSHLRENQQYCLPDKILQARPDRQHPQSESRRVLCGHSAEIHCPRVVSYNAGHHPDHHLCHDRDNNTQPARPAGRDGANLSGRQQTPDGCPANSIARTGGHRHLVCLNDRNQ